jgi:uncharacterized SAM-binding protein YcdF (DUF218 family)
VLLVIVAVLLLAVWGGLGRPVVEKIISDALMPLGLICFTLLTLASDRFARGQRNVGVQLAILFAFVFLTGNTMVANAVIRSLEGRYESTNPLAGSSFAKVVLLGGATAETMSGDVQVNQNGDRVVMAARMYHRGFVKTICCSGEKTASVGKFAENEADHSKRLLIDLGVPARAIEVIGGRNTSEEMKIVAKLSGDEPIGILTSAWHLPRAMRLAEAAGINAQPLPCGFLADANRDLPMGAIVRDCVPNHRALSINAVAASEYLAALVGR